MIEKKFIVQLEEGVWIANTDGDPGRTIVEDNAHPFNSRSQAELALEKTREYRPFENAEIKALKDKPFYIWSPHWSKQKDSQVFYMPDSNGYTTNLEAAGKYSEEEIREHHPEITTRQEYKEKVNDPFYNQSYAVHENNLEILGTPIRAVSKA